MNTAHPTLQPQSEPLIAHTSDDTWLIEQVQAARDDVRPRISHEVVLQRSAIRRESLINQHELVEL